MFSFAFSSFQSKFNTKGGTIIKNPQTMRTSSGSTKQNKEKEAERTEKGQGPIAKFI
jgi:hypothetical protein